MIPTFMRLDHARVEALRAVGRCGRVWLMVPEAPLQTTEDGLEPKGEGWFVLNARDALATQRGTWRV